MGCWWSFFRPSPRPVEAHECSIELFNEIWRDDQLTPLLAEEDKEAMRTLSFEVERSDDNHEYDNHEYDNQLMHESVIQQIIDPLG